MESAKAMVLADLADLSPGLTRAGLEEVLQLIDWSPAADKGLSLASALTELAPRIAQRASSLSAARLTKYLHVLRSATVLALQMWTANGKAPSAAAIATGVEALDD